MFQVLESVCIPNHVIMLIFLGGFPGGPEVPMGHETAWHAQGPPMGLSGPLWGGEEISLERRHPSRPWWRGGGNNEIGDKFELQDMG